MEDGGRRTVVGVAVDGPPSGCGARPGPSAMILERRTAVAVMHVVETRGVFAGGELHGAGLTAALDGADHGLIVDEQADGGVGLRRESVFAGARHEELAGEDKGELAGFFDGSVGEAGGHAGGDGVSAS